MERDPEFKVPSIDRRNRRNPEANRQQPRRTRKSGNAPSSKGSADAHEAPSRSTVNAPDPSTSQQTSSDTLHQPSIYDYIASPVFPPPEFRTEEQWEQILAPLLWPAKIEVDVTELLNKPIFGAGLTVPVPASNFTANLSPPGVPTKMGVSQNTVDKIRNFERKEEDLYVFKAKEHPYIPQPKVPWTKRPVRYLRDDDGTLYIPEVVPPRDVSDARAAEAASASRSETPELEILFESVSRPQVVPPELVAPVNPISVHRPLARRPVGTAEYPLTDLYQPPGAASPYERHFGTNRCNPFFKETVNKNGEKEYIPFEPSTRKSSKKSQKRGSQPANVESSETPSESSKQKYHDLEPSSKAVPSIIRPVPLYPHQVKSPIVIAGGVAYNGLGGIPYDPAKTVPPFNCFFE